MSSPEEMAQSMIDNMEAKTGKPLDAWLAETARWPEDKHGQIVKRLKSEHGITHGFANLIAHKTLKSSAHDADDADLVSDQYSGKKADLKPIYEALIGVIQDLGSDVELAPKKAYVSVRRKKQFGIIQPSTATRVDVGLNLKDVAPTDRLEASGSFNAMVTHRVRLGQPGEVDAQLKAWLKEAYARAG